MIARETRGERFARMQAEYAAYTAGGGTMSQADFISAGISARVEAPASTASASVAIIRTASVAVSPDRPLCRCGSCGQMSHTVRGGECDACSGIS